MSAFRLAAITRNSRPRPVVVGRPARNVKNADVLDYIAGYTVLNDILARDRQLRDDWGGIFANDWLLGKCWQGFAPMGPSIIPREFVLDPYNLRITCTVNGKVLQDSTTRNLIFNIHSAFKNGKPLIEKTQKS